MLGNMIAPQLQRCQVSVYVLRPTRTASDDMEMPLHPPGKTPRTAGSERKMNVWRVGVFGGKAQ